MNGEQQKDIAEFIINYYNENHKELHITSRIKEQLLPMIEKNAENESEIIELLSSEKVMEFIKSRQPYYDSISYGTVNDIMEYFRKDQSLSKYSVECICRRSNYPDDAYLYSVVARKDDNSYTCWSCWNDKTKSLNHGHYGLKSKEEGIEILKDNFYDITDEPDEYGIDLTIVNIENESIVNERDAADIEVAVSRKRQTKNTNSWT